jgi:hypothetical protein
MVYNLVKYRECQMCKLTSYHKNISRISIKKKRSVHVILLDAVLKVETSIDDTHMIFFSLLSHVKTRRWSALRPTTQKEPLLFLICRLVSRLPFEALCIMIQLRSFTVMEFTFHMPIIIIYRCYYMLPFPCMFRLVLRTGP